MYLINALVIKIISSSVKKPYFQYGLKMYFMTGHDICISIINIKWVLPPAQHINNLKVLLDTKPDYYMYMIIAHVNK